ncbi:FecR family protein [Pseudoduganella sp. LjRoot289]|uniref:FecR family protein n=1 Tax=Pseudoduganella sp. LjRoot289 TaxID=3342314 RepID=UPI003ECF2194
MLRPILATLSLALAATSAQAAEAGKIIFVAGEAQVAGAPAQLNAAVQEGDLLTTGALGYVYIKTVDKGLFILRPNTKARIATYHVDQQNPANTRIKLELLSGVARSQSGEAVKLARQNFRFNTPVAAIGVRGTDFTVFTDQDTSRVAVISGGVTVSGFGGACRPEGSGPCEGVTARELSATQKGQLLQIQRGQSAPQLLPSNNTAPDMVAPPRADEPLVKVGATGAGAPSPSLGNADPNLDPKKSANLNQFVSAATQPPPTVLPPPTVEKEPTPLPVVEQPVVTPPVVTQPPPVVVTPPVVTPPVVVEPPPVVTPPVVVEPPPPPPAPREISWGRWQAIADQSATSGLSKAGAERLAQNDYFVLFRSKEGAAYTVPEKGSIGFQLAGSEAYVRNQTTQAVSAATLENAQLLVDFGAATFNTSMDVLNGGDRVKLKSNGVVAKDGQMFGNSLGTGVNMTVRGILGPNSDATYLFQGRMDSQRVVSGITTWGK